MAKTGKSTTLGAGRSLEQFVRECGSQEKAAQTVGVAFATLNRWLNEHDEPTGLSLRRLHELGVRTIAGKALPQ